MAMVVAVWDERPEAGHKTEWRLLGPIAIHLLASIKEIGTQV